MHTCAYADARTLSIILKSITTAAISKVKDQFASTAFYLYIS